MGLYFGMQHVAGIAFQVFLVIFLLAVIVLSAKMDLRDQYTPIMSIAVIAGLIGAVVTVLIRAIRRRWSSHGRVDHAHQRDGDDEQQAA